MADKENRRRCFKCDSSPLEDGVKLFRFPNPGTRNLFRCESWAKYIFPDRNYSSIELQKKLYSEHRMLCQRHFKDEDFVDGCKKQLSRSAIPCDTQPELPNISLDQPPSQPQDQPGPSQPRNQPGPSQPRNQPGPSQPRNQPGPSQPRNQPGPSQARDQPGPSQSRETRDQPGPSQPREPLGDISNLNVAANTQPSNKTKMVTEREKELFQKCNKYIRHVCQLQNRIKKLKSKAMLKALEEDNSVKKLSKKISPSFALLLQGQIRNSKFRLRGRRWTKEEKITALRIFKRSPTCYRLLRRLFTLPSPSTLKSLLNKVPFGVGLNEPVFKVLKDFIKTQKPSDNEYILMFDEMSIKKHLSYDSKNDIIEGFQDHGNQGRSGLIAGYALVFMIGGIRKRVKQPIAHFFSSGFSTADRLAVLIKEVLHHCFEAGVNIAAIVCDMDGVNRRALSILGASAEHPTITIENREIVTMYDTPHLLKCFRNMFIKYDIECKTNINSNSKTGRGVAKWSHIREFYEIDNKNPNFVFAPCLKKDHLDPNTKQKMKVNLAAQVLSHTVAAGMYSKISDGSLTAAATATADVVANMDKLFDCLNSDTADLRRGKSHATNLTAVSPHLKFFQQMKEFFSTLKFIGCPRKPPSQEGWVWTINAVERLWRNLAQKHKINSLATRRLQQDALENLFGCIRGNCGSNTNPTCGQFVAGLKTAILSNLSHMGITGNCETDNSVVINNFDTLLSVSQSKQTVTEEDAVSSASSTLASVLLFEVDEALDTNNSEIQACAYVAGFLLKKLPTSECESCKKIFSSPNIEPHHLFVVNREYDECNQSLNYAHRDLVSCVELCASAINQFLKEKAHIKLIKKYIVNHLKNIANFDFLQPCIPHKEANVENIINCVFFICIKRFCIIKNRSFAEEASASALKRKMNIILHK